MRDSNYHSVINNRAAVTITTSLYDRRALDVTSDKPLVNSLNHLTYLVSSSAKVRETLSNDGGLERLVEILRECRISRFCVAENAFTGEKKLLTAWKWTLAFQCLVLIGTRGTERIRQKVVRAGMLPVIATVLDNYVSLHEGSFFGGAACGASSLADFYVHMQGNEGPGNHGNHGNHGNRHVHPEFREHAAQPQNPAPQNQNHTFNRSHNFTAQQPAERQDGLNGEQNDQPMQNVQQPQQQNGPGAAFAFPAGEPLPDRPPFASAPATMTRDTATETQTPRFGNNLHTAHPNSAHPHAAVPGPSFDELAQKSAGTFFAGNNYPGPFGHEDYEMLSVGELFKMVRDSFRAGGARHACPPGPGPDQGSAQGSGPGSVDTEIRRRCLIMSIVRKLTQKKQQQVIYHCDMDDCEYDMDSSLQFLSNLYLQDEKSAHAASSMQAKVAPRSFTDCGVIVPRDDDVVWCLQLLAYISKYPYLKDVLQDTHVLMDMSIRDSHVHTRAQEVYKTRCRMNHRLASFGPRSQSPARAGPFCPPASPALSQQASVSARAARFQRSPSNSPELSNLNIRNENFDLASDKLDLYSSPENGALVEDPQGEDPEESGDSDDGYGHKCGLGDGDDPDGDEYLSTLDDDAATPAMQSSRFTKLFAAIASAEAIANDLERELALFRLSDKVNDCIEEECRALSSSIIEKRLEEKQYLAAVWNYDTYDKFDIDGEELSVENDFDLSLVEYRRMNLFPMVEKFTFLAGTDMYYWSGVIMRNSCRRNDSKGGVRQCGNLECGKWEKTPREFSKCKRCKRTKYCSRDCQMRAWHCHKNWCVPSTSSTSSTATDTTNMAYDSQHERGMNAGNMPSDSDANGFSAGEASRQASTSDQETPRSDL